jgi:hypothetical protein
LGGSLFNRRGEVNRWYDQGLLLPTIFVWCQGWCNDKQHIWHENFVLRIKLKRRHARVVECASSTFGLNEYDVFFFLNQWTFNTKQLYWSNHSWNMCAINVAHQTYISKLASNMSNYIVVDDKFKKCKIVVWKAQKDTYIILKNIVVYHSLMFVTILSKPN